MGVVLTNRQRKRRINLRRLKQIADALLVDLKIADAELGVHLVAAPEMIRLNETHLHHAGATDVIAFDYADSGGPCFVTTPKVRAPARCCPPLHGDIIICVDEAVRAARRFRTSWQWEIVRYLVHGVLHLQGHEDSHPGARRRMKREEDRRLRSLVRRFSLAQRAHPAKLPA